MNNIIYFFWYPFPLFIGLMILYQAFTFLFFSSLQLYFMVSCLSFGCGPTLIGTWIIFPLTLTGLSFQSIYKDMVPFVQGSSEWLKTAHAILVFTLYLGLYEILNFYRALFA